MNITKQEPKFMKHFMRQILCDHESRPKGVLSPALNCMARFRTGPRECSVITPDFNYEENILAMGSIEYHKKNRTLRS